jgi:FtsZ-binding cell division protein ZapB
MASDDLTAIDVLRAEIARLQADNSALSSELSQHRDALEVIGNERDDLAKQMQTPNDLQSRIRDLEGQIRTGRHRDVFAKLAKGKVDDSAIGDLFDMIRAKPDQFGAQAGLFDQDQADEKAYEAILAKAKERAGYAFLRESQEQEQAAARQTPNGFRFNQTPTPAGTGRADRNNGANGTIITADHRADPKFMLDPRNREVLALAAAEGRIR